MIKIINNVLTKQDCFALYQGLISDNIWNLNRKSDLKLIGGAFPGVNLIQNSKIFFNNQYWIGYFNCLFDRINQKLLEQHNFNLSRKIQRIDLNAQNDNHYTEFHADQKENTFSIVGFLTPQWAEEWGGELNIEGKVIKYNPGDFILFESTKLHQSQKIKKIPYWRTSVSYVIEK
jgi:hypothetical protein|tara:strand:- start:814 stop:1338 length:525 start_codon:yes stop_codon:yes gene_type:complete